jgi:hypothetical protein
MCDRDAGLRNVTVTFVVPKSVGAVNNHTAGLQQLQWQPTIFRETSGAVNQAAISLVISWAIIMTAMTVSNTW